MTPTREQVIEWAKEAGLLNRAAFNHETELYRLCNLAFDAGRDQGLREAKEVCEAHKADWRQNARGCTSGMYDHMADAAHDCAAAIEQLRACWSAATPG